MALFTVKIKLIANEYNWLILINTNEHQLQYFSGIFFFTDAQVSSVWYTTGLNRKFFCSSFLSHCTKNGFPSRISSVTVTKSVVSYGFGHIYWKNPEWKLHFLCSDYTWNEF